MPTEELRKTGEWYKGRRDCLLRDACLPEEETYPLMLSKGALGACTTWVSLLPPASPYSVHRRRQNHSTNPQAHQLFSSRPQQEHKAPWRLRHAARMPHGVTSSQAQDPGSVSPLQRGRSRVRTLRGRRGVGRQEGALRTSLGAAGSRAAAGPGQAESRQGRSTAVYWQHERRRRRRRARCRPWDSSSSGGGPGAAPGLCQRLALGDLQEQGVP